MGQTALLRIETSLSPEKLALPKSVDDRLQYLLDRQDRGEKLTKAERKEAEGLVELSDLLTLLRLKAERVRPGSD